MSVFDKDLAASGVVTPPHVTQLFAGDSEVVTEEGETVVAGTNLAKYTVVGRITASGKLKAHTPGANDGSEVAIGILTQAANAASADVPGLAIYTAGFFNHEALTWHASLTTLAARKAVFARTPIRIGSVRL